MAQDFRKRMGLSNANPNEVRARFINRIHVSVFRWLEDNKGATFWDENFIWWISEQMGESWGDQVRPREYGSGYWSNLTLEKMSAGDFYKTLEVVEKCHQYIAEGLTQEIYERYSFEQDKKINQRHFEERMERIMLLSEGDLGVFWKDGKFYPSGAKELDEALIADTLDWLEKYPAARKQFSVALKHYEKSLQDVSAGKDTITNCYTSIENLAQEHLQNKHNFEKNSNALVEKLGLPTEYKNVVNYYKQLAHEYGSRHAGTDPKPKEVEAFVYLTGLLMRLI